MRTIRVKNFKIEGEQYHGITCEIVFEASQPNLNFANYDSNMLITTEPDGQLYLRLAEKGTSE